MATYYRPNLTKAQLESLQTLVETALKQTAGFEDPAFDSIYQLRIKLSETKPISTSKQT